MTATTKHEKVAAPASGPMALMPMMMGFMASQTIYVAARLGIADLLRDGPRSSSELARETETHAPSLNRLLRALATLGLLSEIEPGKFALTDMGMLLRSDVPGSMRNLALLFAGEVCWKPWGELLECVRTGEVAFDRVFGVGSFEYFTRNPEMGSMFNDAMTEATRWAALAVGAVYDFSRLRKIVDVGGGNGTLLAAILARHPALHGVLFDLPTGIAAAKGHLEAAGVAERCEIASGDFFQSVPSGGDAYLLKSVIHDWDDERSSAILRNCRRAMQAGGTLLLIEPIMPETVDASMAVRGMAMSDLNMLVVAGGRERTEAEFRSLYEKSGFRLTRTVAAAPPSNYSVIEGEPA